MASLLGSKYCIESLRGDVSDLQSAVADVLSRVGPSVSFRSWKYPDKVSTDVSIVELLETHVYSEDQEERQIAHVILMELVIDRYHILLCDCEIVKCLYTRLPASCVTAFVGLGFGVMVKVMVRVSRVRVS